MYYRALNNALKRPKLALVFWANIARIVGHDVKNNLLLFRRDTAAGAIPSRNCYPAVISGT